MPEVCTSRNLDVTSGVLGLEPWSVPRMVSQVVANSGADGSISSSGLISQPGRLLISATQSWVSDSSLPLMMRLVVSRAYRSMVVSNPNAVQMWDSWNVAVDATPRDPDSYNLVNSLCTLGFDVGTNNVAQPYAGVISQDYPATASEEWFTLPPGSTLNVKYRCYVWTPPPWSNNANANSPSHSASARSTTLRLWAFPTADTDVR
jgi:hypothetical protein